MGPILYTGSSATGPSALVFAQLDIANILVNPNKGYGLLEDFCGFGGSVTTNVGTYAAQSGMYKSYEDNSCALTPAAVAGGEVALATTTSDNVEVWLQSGYSQAAPFKIASTAGRKLVFEARIKISTITDSKCGFFVGLGEEGLAAADTIADAGTLASKDLIGFFRPEGDGDGIDFIYRKAGQTMQTVLEDITVAADTYIKLGFIYDPEKPVSERITIVVDGAAKTTYVTQTNIEAATFPDGEELAPLIGLKNATNVLYTLTCDWLYAFQER